MSREIRNDEAQQRYYLLVDGEQAGLIDYNLEDGTIDILHTEIDEEKREHGLASWFLQQVLDEVRTTDLTLVAHCAFARQWLTEHEDYQDLLAR
jgi:predicted GNAT family acetyltransferase